VGGYRGVVEKFFLFVLLSWITGNPLLALLAILLMSAGAYGYLTGRIFRLPRAVTRSRTIRELERAVRTNPHDAAARADLGRLLVEARRHREAVPHLEMAAARMPEVAETLYYLGAARLGAGDRDEGQPLIEEALARDPRLRYGEPHLTLGDYYLDRDPARAVPYLEELTALNVSSVEGRYKLARAYLAIAEPERARRALDDAIETYRGSPAFRRREERLWRLRAGWLRRKIGRAAPPRSAT